MEHLHLYSPFDGRASAVEVDPTRYRTDRGMHWRGKQHWYMPCLEENAEGGWAAEYPVAFHGYKDPASLFQLHAFLFPPPPEYGFRGGLRAEALAFNYRPKVAT